MQTQLGHRGHGDDDRPAADEQVDPHATRIGQRAAAGAGETGRGRRSVEPDPAPADGTRFGPGVPPVAAWTVPARRRSRSGPGAVLLATVATAAFVGLVVWLLLSRPAPLQVTGTAVSVAEPGTACDVTVDVVGTIDTNGQAGVVRYQWLRSDGTTSAVLVETVESGVTSVQVHLMWTLAGEGTYPARATLRVLAPDPGEAAAGFTYTCRS
ncbi:hypothetical protein ACQEVB_04510 [Pseudonocardia sp. CA-107938]|uniref:hypothetical protein n=1 Tax=Pseudonocardia sp. CA-107938 TaxID=3240021 RepID=UPI003D8C2E4C